MAIKVRDYEVRLARNKEERRQVRQLRYDVFVEEDGAGATEEQKILREEYDSYDSYSDYMIVLHNGKVVATYRIIDRAMADENSGFYMETEFDLTKIKNVRGNICEMSRACVAKPYRETGLVLRLLWMGLGEYVVKNKIVLIFGSASFIGKNPAESAMEISYLYYNHLAPSRIRATVRDDLMAPEVDVRRTKMKIIDKFFIDEEKAKRNLPPLFKGYLNLGAKFGKGVFIDAPFNTYDIFVVMETSKMSRQYQKYFLGSENALDDLKIEDSAMRKVGKTLMLPLTGAIALAKLFLKPDEADDIEVINDEE